MGLKSLGSTVSSGPVAGEEEQWRRRFGIHFPRLFAYVRPWVSSDAQARDIVVEAFARAFNHPGEMTDEEFPIVLFGLVREVCRRGDRAAGRPYRGLTLREREVLGLVFDAQMCRETIARLLKMTEREVSTTLVRGLKKLRSSAASVQAFSLQP